MSTVKTDELLEPIRKIVEYLNAQAEVLGNINALDTTASPEAVTAKMREIITALRRGTQSTPSAPTGDGGLTLEIERLAKAVGRAPAIPSLGVKPLGRRGARLGRPDNLLLPIEWFWAKIDDRTGKKYSFDEVVVDDTADRLEWVELTGGRAGLKGDATCAYELTGESEAVPSDGTAIVKMYQLIAADGTPRYAFPFRPRRVAFAGACVIDTDNVDTASANDWDITFTAVTYAGGGGELAKSILVKLVAPVTGALAENLKLAIRHQIDVDYSGIANACGATLESIYEIKAITEAFDTEGANCAVSGDALTTDAPFGGTVAGSVEAGAYVNAGGPNDYLNGSNAQSVADEDSGLVDATAKIYGFQVIPCEPALVFTTADGEATWTYTITVGQDGFLAL